MFKMTKKKPSNLETFNSIMDFAKEMMASNLSYTGKHPIFDLIRLLGRKLQTDYLMRLLYCDEEVDKDELLYSTLFIDEDIEIEDGIKVRNLLKVVDDDYRVYLKHDLILAWPSKRVKLINCLKQIGEGREKGLWKEDKKNHFVELWMPIGIVWVNGGTHSIATGIIQGEGVIQPEITYDMTQTYAYIYSDGKHFYRKSNNKPICRVHSVEFAAIFEIGRLMVKHNITF